MRGPVCVDEARVGLGVVGEDHEWGMVVKPVCALAVADERAADEARVASGEEGEEIGIERQIEGGSVIGKSHEVPRWSNAPMHAT
ncbi:hypothetical protein ATY77_26305 [Rhizobium sp. R634]|nr:hypothetical protein ATY77_26305 [Rhizobium sp. R634]